MEGLKVRCRSCGSFDLYETTEKYDPDIPLTGDMLRLQKPYDSFNWEVYDGALADKSTSRFLMFCTRCGGYITANGELLFVDESFDIDKAIAERDYDRYIPEIPETQKALESTEVWKSMKESVKAMETLEISKIDKAEKRYGNDEPFQTIPGRFICPKCGKPCASKAGLMAHIRLTHKEK